MQAHPIPSSEVQLELLEAPDGVGAAEAVRSLAHVDSRHRMTINLGCLGPGLRALARQQRTTVSALIRRVLRPLLGGAPATEGGLGVQAAAGGRWARVNLNLPFADAMSLARRAQAGDMSRSELVRSLLAGLPPVVVASDHTEAVRTLVASNDRLAVLCADLRDFVRLLGRAATTRAEAEPYRARMASLEKDVRDHLKLLSMLAAELRPYRRRRE